MLSGHLNFIGTPQPSGADKSQWDMGLQAPMVQVTAVYVVSAIFLSLLQTSSFPLSSASSPHISMPVTIQE